MSDSPTARPPDSPSTTKGHILIVDDNPNNLRVLNALLAENGYMVRPSNSGLVALESARAIPPDLVLLDIKMPGMDGYEVCRRLKADERSRDIPVIFISALGETMNKVKAFSLGGVDYITKPFQAEEVLARLKTHLSLRNLQKQLIDQNVRLQREIKARRKADAALQRNLDELEVRVEQRTSELARANEALRESEERYR
ncbi:MAG: response regulator, partial [Desulfobacterales bacterium]|nr:response regulator [Desulfobacterales bacterium]